MPTKYRFAKGVEHPWIKNGRKANAQKLGESFEALRAAGTRVTPTAFWKAVRAAGPKHPAYKHFEWNETLAAQKTWDATARALIGWIEVVVDDRGPMPLAIPIKDAKGFHYVSTPTEVMSSVELQRAWILSARRDLEAFALRFRRFAKIATAVQAAIAAVDELLAEIDSQKWPARNSQNGQETRPTL